MKSSTLANSLGRIRFRTLGGVESVSIEGQDVVGRWESPERMRWIGEAENPSKLAESFANYPDTDIRIVKFTKTYGPLMDEFDFDRRFGFTLADWRKNQALFRRNWERQMKSGTGAFQSLGKQGEGLAYADGRLWYQVSTLWELMFFGLLIQPRDLLRKCLRPDCPNPYYIAHHREQRYCSEPCAHWAQRQWKRDWWNRVGSKDRNKKAKRKGRRHRSSSRGRRSQDSKGEKR